MGLEALSKGVKYFYVREPGRSPLCVVSSNGIHLDQFGIVRMFVRSRFVVDECSFEDMLSFPADRYSTFIVGSLRIEVNHSLSLDFSKVFKRFFVQRFDNTYTV